MKIESERLVLKTLEEKDATEEYASWLCDPEVNKYLETKTATIDSLKEYIKEHERKDCFLLGLFSKAKHIGNIKLEVKKDMGELGIMIGNKEYWGRGFGTEAVNTLCSYAFSNLGLKEISLGVIKENERAVQTYKKAGFKVDKIDNNIIIMKKYANN